MEISSFGDPERALISQLMKMGLENKALCGAVVKKAAC